jgi:hypothetical protein
MKLIKNEFIAKIVAEEGKHIREINDVYTPESTDEETGDIIPAHEVYYTDTVYVSLNFTEEQMNELYVEEDIEE